ncbi:MAG: hypothetical protein J6A89_04975 [Clostridia bacterium]|nr:hypothetical protein [Clostridia bacterium]
MILQDYLNDDQVNLCEESGILIEDRDYSCEEIFNIEHQINEYINENCTDEKFYLLEEKFDEILDILMDLENENDEINPMIIEIYEDDHVELNNGKTGIVADITNNVYTIEVDEKFKTGDIDEDIMIVAANSIIRKI